MVAIADPADPRTGGYLRAARLAAREAGVRVVEGGVPDARRLARATGDPDLIGAVTLHGADAIESARDVIEAAGFPVIELADDLYGTTVLGPAVFQAATPHSWQAWRLARYFGPGDRGFRAVGLLRDRSRSGEAAARGLAAMLAERGLALVDAAGSPEEGVAHLEAARPPAVVVAGSSEFSARALALLSAEPRRYAGRSRVGDGWRPQVAGFESLVDVRPPAPPGTVAAGDYLRAGPGDAPVDAARRFREAWRARHGADPQGWEVAAHDAVLALTEASRRAGDHGDGRGGLLAALEGFDRVRFGSLPISLGPDDHLLAERDVLGLWTLRDGRWKPLMRTFTSDLERTNVLEDDWAAFFEGAVPGGEAPLYRTARSGVTTGREDDLS